MTQEALEDPKAPLEVEVLRPVVINRKDVEEQSAAQAKQPNKKPGQRFVLRRTVAEELHHQGSVAIVGSERHKRALAAAKSRAKAAKEAEAKAAKEAEGDGDNGDDA